MIIALVLVLFEILVCHNADSAKLVGEVKTVIDSYYTIMISDLKCRTFGIFNSICRGILTGHIYDFIKFDFYADVHMQKVMILIYPLYLVFMNK